MFYSNAQRHNSLESQWTYGCSQLQKAASKRKKKWYLLICPDIGSFEIKKELCIYSFMFLLYILTYRVVKVAYKLIVVLAFTLNNRNKEALESLNHAPLKAFEIWRWPNFQVSGHIYSIKIFVSTHIFCSLRLSNKKSDLSPCRVLNYLFLFWQVP